MKTAVALVLVCVLGCLASRVAANCQSSADCKEGFLCDINGQKCIEVASGNQNCLEAGCDAEHECDEVTLRCVYTPKLRSGHCSETQPCTGDLEDCVDGLCRVFCKDDRECNEHEHCFKHGPDRGYCIPFGCEEDEDCSYGQECSWNMCATRVTCDAEDRFKGNCGKGRFCSSAGFCMPSSLKACESDDQCPNFGSCLRGVCIENHESYLRKKYALRSKAKPNVVPDVQGKASSSDSDAAPQQQVSTKEPSKEEEVSSHLWSFMQSSNNGQSLREQVMNTHAVKQDKAVPERQQPAAPQTNQNTNDKNRAVHGQRNNHNNNDRATNVRRPRSEPSTETEQQRQQQQQKPQQEKTKKGNSDIVEEVKVKQEQQQQKKEVNKGVKDQQQQHKHNKDTKQEEKKKKK